MDSSFRNVIGGSLKLKRKGLPVASKSKKRKVFRSKCKEEPEPEVKVGESESREKTQQQLSGECESNSNNLRKTAEEGETNGREKSHREVVEEEAERRGSGNVTEDSDDDLESADEALLLLEEEEQQYLTPAEKSFRLVQKKREKQRINERLKLTHRQRVEKLNAHLASLSEHFDQPRVGPG